MPEKDSSTFRMRFDQEQVTEYQSERDDFKIEKLGQRLTLFFILLPCLVGIILFVAYMDLRGRVGQSQDTGAHGVQKLSQDLESRFSSLSLKQAALEEQLGKNVDAMQNTGASSVTGLKKVRADIRKLKAMTTSKEELQSLQEDLAKLQGDLAAFQESISVITTEMGVVKKDLGKKIARLVKSVDETQNEILESKAALATVSVSTIGQKELALAIKKEQVAFTTKLKETAKKLEARLSRIETQLKSAGGQSAETSSPEPQAPSTPEAELPVPVPGSFVEQELNE